MNCGASGVARESLELEQHLGASLQRIGGERKQKIHFRLAETILSGSTNTDAQKLGPTRGRVRRGCQCGDRCNWR